MKLDIKDSFVWLSLKMRIFQSSKSSNKISYWKEESLNYKIKFKKNINSMNKLCMFTLENQNKASKNISKFYQILISYPVNPKLEDVIFDKKAFYELNDIINHKWLILDHWLFFCETKMILDASYLWASQFLYLFSSITL